MGIDDILKKVENEKEMAEKIRSALSHPSLNDYEIDGLKKELCKITGSEFISQSEMKRKEKAYEDYEKERYEIEVKYNKEIEKLLIERSSHLKSVPGGFNRFGDRCGPKMKTKLFRGGKVVKIEEQISRLEIERINELNKSREKYKK